MKKIALLVPDMPTADEILPYLRRIDEARWYTNFGPLVKEFERALAAALPAAGTTHVTTVANCTLGLELALAASSLPANSRVLVPALTFVATAMAVRRSGHHPVLADVDAGNWLLTPEIAREAIRRMDIDCVMPVSSFGCPQDAQAWDAFTEETGKPVIVDAAAAFGNQRIGRRTVWVFSLHATKSLGIGEGGFVASADEKLVQRVRQISNFGIDIVTGNSTLPGTNAKMSEYHAAVGLAALARWQARRRQRVDLAADYSAAIAAACPGVKLQERPGDGAYTIMPVCLPEGCEIERVRRRLAEARIETRRWYVPLILDHLCLIDVERCGELPMSMGLAARLLGLPLHLDLSAEDRARVCHELSAALVQKPAAVSRR
jgi:dTDP-4-amino-4,6-dideoxygalactose transaminase